MLLAEFTGTPTNATAIARQILEKITENNDTHVSYSQHRYIFHVKRTDGLTVLCMAEDNVGRFADQLSAYGFTDKGPDAPPGFASNLTSRPRFDPPGTINTIHSSD